MRQKTCKECKQKFIPDRPLQSCCSIPCAIEHGRRKRVYEEKKDIRERKEKLKTKADYIREAQQAVNQWVRVRDQLLGHGCICCNRPLDYAGGTDAGHYRSTGSAPHMRFMVYGNINAQSKQCNRWRGGRPLDQRINIVSRYGLDTVEAIESDQTSRKYSIDDLIEIRDGFRSWKRELEKEKPG